MCKLMLMALAIGGVLGCQSGQQATAGEADGKGQKNGEPVKTVTLKTTDGWSIVGDEYAATGKARGTVILLHQRGGRASDWVPLCRALQAAHLTALALDQRGAGRSTQGPGPMGDDAPWPTSGDIAAAVALVSGKTPIGLAGASYGANNALLYAAAHENQIKALALFSPGANYHGLDALAGAKMIKSAVVIYHDKNDAIAGDGPQKINALVPGRDHALRLSGGDEHGTALLTEANIRDAVTFFQRTLK